MLSFLASCARKFHSSPGGFGVWRSNGSPRPQAHPSSTLIVFDFDCTLSAVHMWHTLRDEDQQQSLLQDPTKFYTMIFGGAKRLEAVREMLRQLSDWGYRIRVLSYGITAEISAALAHLRMDSYVDQVMGNTDFCEGVGEGANPPKMDMIGEWTKIFGWKLAQ
eukprot:c15346_g1_i1.p1 GENE.c15346_g1_i1~~c15346_g1_i1.p1  ORF type:complete len:163 (+),score=18.38 c15346_g1_i1:43-531(+)